MCRGCTQLTINVNRLERQLLEEEFSLEKSDEEIARQMNEILVRESSGISQKDDELLTSLVERLFQDEKRRKKLIKEIWKLQRKKK